MNSDTPVDRKVTKDALADQLINQYIEKLYPNLPNMEKRWHAYEDQAIFESFNNKEETP